MATAIRPRNAESSGSNASALVSRRETKNEATEAIEPAARRNVVEREFEEQLARVADAAGDGCAELVVVAV